MPDQLGYVVNDLDRAGIEQEHEAFLALARETSALSVVIAGDVPVLLNEEGGGLAAAFPLRLLGGRRRSSGRCCSDGSTGNRFSPPPSPPLQPNR